jgi:hypothetical protein
MIMSTQSLANGVFQSTSRPVGMECRVFERHSCGLATSCQPVAARGDRDLAWPAEIRDVSAGGVGLVLGRRFERGAGLAIEIPESPTAPADTLLARVIHTTALPEGEWLLGCSFISELSQDELQRLLALAKSLRTTPSQWDTALEEQIEEPVASVSRADAANLVLEITWRGTYRGRTAHCQAPRLHVNSWPVLPGTILRVWFRKQPLDKTCLQVENCVRTQDGWSVDYTFIDTPSDEARRALGF